MLAGIARTQPQAAHAAFTYGLRNRWSFGQRTLRTLGAHLQPLEDAIRLKFLPKPLGMDSHAVSDNQRALLALPARLGGLGLDKAMRDRASPDLARAIDLAQEKGVRCLLMSPAGRV